MNKFYQQYKDLFTLTQKSAFIHHYPKINYHQYKSQPLSYLRSQPQLYLSQNNKNQFINSQMQNQYHSLFKNYTKNEVTYKKYDKPKYQSFATKQLSNVILPKLRIYDKQIQTKLKRFKTEHQDINKNTSLLILPQRNINENSLPNKINSNNINFDNKINRKLQNYQPQIQNNRFKHGYKYKTEQQNNIFHRNYDVTNEINQIKSLKRNSFYKKQGKKLKLPTQQNQMSFILNPQSPSKQLNINKIKINKIKKSIFYNANSPHQNNFQSQYQRSYSNTKLPLDLQQQQQYSRQIEHQQSSIKNFHNNNQYNKHQNRQMIQFISNNNMNNMNDKYDKYNKFKTPDNSRIRLQAEYHIQTQPNSPYGQKSHQRNQYFSVNNKKYKKRSMNGLANKNRLRTQSQIKRQQQGMKFSQYSNQYAFINSRLDDMHKFNNYYNHRNITSYKQAIIRRLQAKNNKQSRRNKLRYMLSKQFIIE